MNTGSTLLENNYVDASLRWTCQDCFPGAIDIGAIGKHHLAYYDGDYILFDVSGEGHSGTELIIFREKPTRYPMSYEEEHNLPDRHPLWKEVNEWMANWTHSNHWKMTIEEAHELYESCIAEGYDPASDFDVNFWLVDKVAELIQNFETWLTTLTYDTVNYQ